MRLRHFSILLIVATTLSAQPPSPPAGTPFKFISTLSSKLPKEVKVYNPEDSDESLHNVGVAHVNLHGSARDDLVIDVGGGSTAGSYHFVFLHERTRYREVLQFEGGAEMLPAKSGFCQIQVWSRAGGGVEMRCVYSYRENRYRLDLCERYRRHDNDVMERLPDGT